MLKCLESESIKKREHEMDKILLTNEKPIFLIPKLAVTVGIKEALILQMLHEGVNDSPIKTNGHTWYQHSYEDWAEQFPFISLDTIREPFSNLKN